MAEMTRNSREMYSVWNGKNTKVSLSTKQESRESSKKKESQNVNA